jgi:hypothetical protein
METAENTKNPEHFPSGGLGIFSSQIKKRNENGERERNAEREREVKKGEVGAGNGNVRRDVTGDSFASGVLKKCPNRSGTVSNKGRFHARNGGFCRVAHDG